MSFDGQVDCQRMLIGPACPLAIIGKPRVAAPAVAAAAPARNLRREAVSVFLGCSLLIESSIGRAMVCLGLFLLLASIAAQVNGLRGCFVPAPALREYGAKARESYPQPPVKA